jgi:flagellar hook-basal body complex protein FliE
MTTIDPIRISELLAEMQRLSATAHGPSAPNAPDGDFAALLKTSVDKVNEAQSSASEMAASFERGDAGTSLPEVMIALQKASLSFQAMTEVRNQLVNAYQEIMNMPV